MRDNSNKDVSSKVLLVDLDGTLIYSDSLFELFFAALKNNPLLLFLFPIYVLNSISYAKSVLAYKYSHLLPQQPVSSEIVNYIKMRKAKGDKVYLLTAANIILAKKIVKKLNLFDAIYASTKLNNLKGDKKAKFIEQRFGIGKVDYIGNSISDIPVWKVSDKVLVANTSTSLERKLNRLFPRCVEFLTHSEKNKLKSFFKLIRIHQWVKNVLIFLPLILSHSYRDTDKVVLSILAFFAFSFSASSTYILNDIMDLDNDRHHSKKRYRPIASGKISIITSVFFMIVLWLSAIYLALNISFNSFLMLLIYTFIVLIYSYKIKKIVIVDIITLAFLYMYRIYFGGISTSIEISSWLASCSVFFFLSLASIKRYVEILKLDTNYSVKGRNYCVQDSYILANVGISSGVASVITFLLYISQASVNFYKYPSILMLEAFVILYFIIKIWIMASRGEVHYDPIVYSIKTKENYILGFLGIVILFFSKPL